MILCCAICERPIDPDGRVFHEIRGFERPRRQGGTNQVRLRERTGRVAHYQCVEKKAAGHDVGQQAIL